MAELAGNEGDVCKDSGRTKSKSCGNHSRDRRKEEKIKVDIMAKKFKTFVDSLDEAKPVSDFAFDAFCKKMKNVVRDARRNQARAMQAAKEVFIGR